MLFAIYSACIVTIYAKFRIYMYGIYAFIQYIITLTLKIDVRKPVFGLISSNLITQSTFAIYFHNSVPHAWVMEKKY